MGYYAHATAANSVSIGNESNVSGINGVGIGLYANVSGASAVALGVGSNAYGESSVAIGSGEKINDWYYRGPLAGDKAIAIGYQAAAWREDSIVLGADSKSGAVAGRFGYDPLDQKHEGEDWKEFSQSPAWVATNNAVSFGSAEYNDDGTLKSVAITRQINNVAAGTDDTDAVNVAQLRRVAGDLNIKFSAEDFLPPVKDENGAIITAAQNVLTQTSGSRLPIIGDGEIVEEEQIGEDDQPVKDEEGNLIKIKKRLDGNINTRVAEDVDGTQAIQITLADNLKLGGPGKDGKDGVDGSIGVAGADGKDGVTIKAEGGQGHIVINGKDGEDGEDGTPGEPGPKADITVVQGPAGVNGKDGETLTRIEYIDPDNPNDTPHQVATLEDGLKYEGNYGDASVTLNNVTKIVGGTTNPLTEEDKAKFVDDNLAVFAEQDGENAKLVLRMNKNLNLPDGSITITPPDEEGNTKTDIVISQNNISMGGNQITNVASGTENRPWNEDDPGYDESWNNVANIGDLIHPSFQVN